ncbi:MAG: hypothetical protein JSW70_08265 [Syntrophobacterales bacterium]|nr:MAG: hypothetical protein JSW70_08265 [Syntrophobacterales bacterium]
MVHMMKDQEKIEAEFAHELVEMRQRFTELEELEIEHKRVEEELGRYRGLYSIAGS